jgi:hypothetical protein
MPRADDKTLVVIDSWSGTVSTDEVDEWERHVAEVAEGLPDPPVHVHHQSPQEPNNWDCGLFLVARLIREIANFKSAIGKRDASPFEIDGPFFSAILREPFNPDHDSDAAVNAVLALDADPVDGSIAANLIRQRSTVDLDKLQRSKAHPEKLQRCKQSADASIQLFTTLAKILRKKSRRMHLQAKRFDATVTTLLETMPVLGAREKAPSPLLADACRVVEEQAKADQRKLWQDSTEIRHAEDVTRDLLNRLNSLVTTLDKHCQTAEAQIHYEKQDAKFHRTQSAKKIRKLTEEIEGVKKLVFDIDSVLSFDE